MPGASRVASCGLGASGVRAFLTLTIRTMKTVIVRNYPQLFHRPSDTRFEARAVDIDQEGAAFVGVAAVEDDVATEHFMNRHGFLVFEHDDALMAGTARNPASVSTETALTREPTEAELQHAAEANEDAARAEAIRNGEQVPAKPKKGKAKKDEEKKGDDVDPAGSGSAGDGAAQ